MRDRPDWRGSVQFLKGVGPVRATALRRLGIETIADLLAHYPRAYLDRSETVPIGRSVPGNEITVSAEVLTSGQRHTHRRQSLQTVSVTDKSGVLYCQWFGQPYILKQFRTGTRVLLSGRLQMRNGQRQLVHPDYEIIDADSRPLHTGRLVPVYPLTSGIGQHWLRKLISETLERMRGEIVDLLPPGLVSAHGLAARETSLFDIHLPADHQALRRARERLVFEEIFLVQLAMGLRRSRRLRTPGVALQAPGDLTGRLVESLPFELTGAQRRVLKEILADLRRGTVMHRLLQGDVGAGKTLVAVIAALFMIEQGYQAMIMAPTEVLAAQHAKTIESLVAPLGVSCALLTGSTPAARRRAILQSAFDGELDLLLGTHALIQDGVSMKRPGLVVVDEQHRFGVRQRVRASEGALAGDTPHVLVMSATPIPRSLALTLCADLDLSVIDALPAGRRPIETRLVPQRDLPDIHRVIREDCAAGRQAFIIYPVIEETEGQDLKAAEAEYEKLADGDFARTEIGLLHGRLKPARKAEIMSAFAAGEIRVLVATTVVEVGVDVPAATRMIIHNPERFGLAQLHQLRGRIGRASEASTCYLVLDRWLAEEALERLRVFASTTDGFRLAEEDLKRRGPGDILGVRQHGLPVFRLANPIRDKLLIDRCAAAVDGILADDPGLRRPEHRELARSVGAAFSEDDGVGNTG